MLTVATTVISKRDDFLKVEEADMILAKLRLPLMKLDDLLNVVRPSGLLSSDAILDAIKEQQEKKSVELTYRGFLCKIIH